MRILVTNDDGIHAPGLKIAEAIARTLSDDVWVVAPESEQSGASHSLTLALPLRLREIGPQHYAVSGTPSDCVLMAVAEIMKAAPPDLILSGVNRGGNLADDVTYSGTVAGAMEGTALGIPSIALSQTFIHDASNHDMGNPDAGGCVPWDCAAEHGPAVIKRLLAAGWPEQVLINVNFPPCPPSEVTGTVVAAQGKRDQQQALIDKRTDMRGHPYYWIGFKRVRSEPAAGSDLAAIYGRAIAVTPLHLNLTEYAVLEKLRQSFKAV